MSYKVAVKGKGGTEKMRGEDVIVILFNGSDVRGYSTDPFGSFKTYYGAKFLLTQLAERGDDEKIKEKSGKLLAAMNKAEEKALEEINEKPEDGSSD